MVEILAIIWRVSMLACFVVLIAVIVTIIDARKRPEPVLLPSVWMWVLGSILKERMRPYHSPSAAS